MLLHSSALALVALSACGDSSSYAFADFADRGQVRLPPCARPDPAPAPLDSVVLLGNPAGICDIIIKDTDVRLASDMLGQVPDPYFPVTLNSRGEFLTPTRHDRGQFAVWSPTGELLETVGRDGDGPGEMRGNPKALVDAWDSVHVRDGADRWSVFDPEFRFQRVIRDGQRLMLPWFSLPMPSGEILTAFFAPPPEDGIYRVFKVVSRIDGKVIRKFGVPGAEENMPRRLLVHASDSTFWAIPQHVYRAEEWTYSGELVRAVKRENEWLDRPDDQIGNDPNAPALPMIGDFHYDRENDLLWVRVMIPDPKYIPDADPAEMLEQVRTSYDVLLEVLDLRSMTILASHRSDGLEGSVAQFLPDGRAVRIAENALGMQALEIVELGLVERR